MFALFYELEDGSMQFITTCETRDEARILGKMFSRYRELPVIGVMNPPSGDTVSLYRFENGKVMSLVPRRRPGMPVATARAVSAARAAHMPPPRSRA